MCLLTGPIRQAQAQHAQQRLLVVLGALRALHEQRDGGGIVGVLHRRGLYQAV